MRTLMAALLAGTAAIAPAQADDAAVDPARKALLVDIIETIDCKIDGANPGAAFLKAMDEHNFERGETRAIAAELVDEGVAVRDGPLLILKTEKCS